MENAVVNDGIERDENGFIPGTTFKTVEELAKGFQETKADHGRISNEYGNLKKEHDGLKSQAQTMAETLKETLNKGKEPLAKGAVDYDAEIANVNAQIEKLDPMKVNYQAELAKLIMKSNSLTADKVKNSVIGEAGKLFQDELKNRDIQASQQQFLDANPTFNTPEMQDRIKGFLSKDRTGMHDKMSAFFALKAEDEAAERTRLNTENEEMKKALELQKGKDATGKVIVKGGSPDQTTKQPKLTGKDRDAAMMDALRKVRGEA